MGTRPRKGTAMSDGDPRDDVGSAATPAAGDAGAARASVDPQASDPRAARGDATRRQVLGDEHVDRADAATTDLDRPFQEYIAGAAWADVWSRDGIDRRTRSLVTIALLAALGHERELRMHLDASHRTGASTDEIIEVLLHVALYAGVPAANTAFAALKEVRGEGAPTDEQPVRTSDDDSSQGRNGT